MAFQFTDENVKELINSGKPVMIDFWATWCGPCKKLGPTIDELAAEYEGKVVIGKYNIDEEGDLATEYRIMSIPTLMFFRDGKPVGDLRLVGFQIDGQGDDGFLNFQPRRASRLKSADTILKNRRSPMAAAVFQSYHLPEENLPDMLTANAGLNRLLPSGLQSSF